MHHLKITDLNFLQETVDNKDLLLGGISSPKFSASTDVKLKTKITFSANINYKTGAEYSGGAGYAGGYAAAASINGNSVAFVMANLQ
jgi:hypothetical protein